MGTAVNTSLAQKSVTHSMNATMEQLQRRADPRFFAAGLPRRAAVRTRAATRLAGTCRGSSACQRNPLNGAVLLFSPDAFPREKKKNFFFHLCGFPTLRVANKCCDGRDTGKKYRRKRTRLKCFGAEPGATTSHRDGEAAAMPRTPRARVCRMQQPHTHTGLAAHHTQLPY